jgi:hypothetical protein
MLQTERQEKISSLAEEHEDDDALYEPVVFDPEATFVDDEIDSDTLAFRDAMRDIYASEGCFELLLP